MAFTVTNRGEAQAYSSNVTIPAFTPGADRLLVLYIFRQNSTAINSVTGHGTWEYVTDILFGGRRSSIYVCLTSSTPSSSDIVINWGSNHWGSATAIEVDGADVSGTASNAIAQSGSSSEKWSFYWHVIRFYY